MSIGEDAIARIRRSLDYVEAHLHRAVRVADMAAAACYSEFHFIRLFNEAVRHSPYDYAMRRRITASADGLVIDGASVLETALEWGFESPDGYSRAFRRVFFPQTRLTA